MMVYKSFSVFTSILAQSYSQQRQQVNLSYKLSEVTVHNDIFTSSEMKIMTYD